MSKTPTVAMDNVAWDQVRNQASAETRPVVQALFLATRDLVDRLESIELRLESIEQVLAERRAS